MSAFKKSIDDYYNKMMKTVSSHMDIDDDKKYKYVFDSKRTSVKIIEKDNDIEIISGDYQIIGMHDVSRSMFYWANNVPFINKKDCDRLGELETFKETMVKNFKEYDPRDVEEVHFFIDNGNFFCLKEYIPFILKLSLFVLKGVWIVPIEKVIEGREYVEYIMLTKSNKIK